MRRGTLVAGIALAVSAISSPAAASPVPVFDWTGFYAGVHGGYAWSRIHNDYPPRGGFGGVVAPFGTGGSFDQTPGAGVAGGHFGFNYQMGPLVTGLEGSISWSGLSQTSFGVFAGIPASYRNDLEWIATATKKIGFTRDNWLFYLKGGLAAGQVFSAVANATFPLSYQEREVYLGWTAGGGVELALTQNWVVGIEYSYFDLGSQQYGSAAPVPGGVVLGQYTVDVTFSTVLARLSYRANTGGHTAYAQHSPTKAPVRAVATWTGLYAGVHGGYGWGGAEYEFPPPQVAPFGPVGTGGQFRQPVDGAIAGTHGGYNYQAGNLVLGLESSLAWTDIKGRSLNPMIGAGVPPNATYDTRLAWFATLTPRIGVASSNWLVFVKGGVAAGRVDSELNSTGFVPNPRFTEQNAHIGWTAGLGLELAWTPNWIVGLEYNYSLLGPQHYGGFVAAIADYNLLLKHSTVLGRVSYKFDTR